MIFKLLTISFDGGVIAIEEHEGQVALTVSDYVLDEKNSSENNEIYKVNNKCAINMDTDDLKQLRDAITYIIESSDES
ncbi:hypothetical protein B4065_3314 [Caldibacillus thermoamylovorans]|uniref:hypothetical protein n=1 Tax=Bacillaceae TaxID=186817 RepID=UPI0005A45A10|nr:MULTISPECIES: hypothetical protein [Bacillaceae]KIO62094.1 hypothetical protein B4065_3314 [Caldibacillus thermoamylovorans]MBU5342325.1 hypothetical protein [Caldifermentibacillus hisashii]